MRQSRGQTASPAGMILQPAVLGAVMASEGDIPGIPGGNSSPGYLFCFVTQLVYCCFITLFQYLCFCVYCGCKSVYILKNIAKFCVTFGSVEVMSVFLTPCLKLLNYLHL